MSVFEQTAYEQRQAAMEARLGMNPCEMYGLLYRAGIQFDWGTQSFRQRGGAVLEGDFLDVVQVEGVREVARRIEWRLEPILSFVDSEDYARPIRRDIKALQEMIDRLEKTLDVERRGKVWKK